jgi:phosphatidylserine/phosphatidylglycerophosphate/cardiolipin synthase-like enzyme
MVENTDSFKEVRIITSLDGPYAIPDAITEVLKTAKNFVLISAPWLGKGFVNEMRHSIPNGVTINVVTKEPEKIDNSFHAINSLYSVAECKGWKVNVKYNYQLHLKLIIVDGATCIFGSWNPTDSGTYYNLEAIEIWYTAPVVERYTGIFNEVWNRFENVKFEQFRLFHGYKQIDNQSYFREIAHKVTSCFDENSNAPILKWKLCKEIQKMGYNEGDVISVLKSLVNDGVLYEPGPDSYRMVNG